MIVRAECSRAAASPSTTSMPRQVNEAFAPVPLAWVHQLGADPEKLNPRGGAIALGHALSSSGTRLLGSVVSYLESTGVRYGLQTMCEGGGMVDVTPHRATLIDASRLPIPNYSDEDFSCLSTTALRSSQVAPPDSD
jgi:hypothetical protein